MSASDEMKARMESAKKAKQDSEALKRKVQETKAAKLRSENLARNQAAASRAKTAAPPRGTSAFGRAGAAGAAAGHPGAKVQGFLSNYTVKKGDTLSQIAKDHYGSGSQSYWKLIQEANQDIIKDPNLIHPGQVFKIPQLPDHMKK